MGIQKYFDDMSQRLSMELSVAFVGRVLSVDAGLTRAEVQPLGLIQQRGEAAKAQASVSVPIAWTARYKLEPVTHEGLELLTYRKISAGDLVICVCCDHDISQDIRGANVLPEAGRHSKNYSVIVGVLP